jgi:hypothetical protein
MTPIAIANRPGLQALAYRVGTHATFLETMKAMVSTQGYPNLAPLRTRDAADPAIALMDAWATVADVLTFYQERIANEGYLRTATERRSLLELANLVGYQLRPGVAASTYLAFNLDKNASDDTVIPAGTRAKSLPGPGETPQPFETAEDLKARLEWNEMAPRLTQPSRLLTDSDARLIETVYVQGTTLNLQPNQPILFEFKQQEDISPVVRWIQSVETDLKANRTKIYLQQSPEPIPWWPWNSDFWKSLIAINFQIVSNLPRIVRPYRIFSPPSKLTATKSTSTSSSSEKIKTIKYASQLSRKPRKKRQAPNPQTLRNISSTIFKDRVLRPTLLVNFGVPETTLKEKTAETVEPYKVTLYVMRSQTGLFGNNALPPSASVSDAVENGEDWEVKEEDSNKIIWLETPNSKIIPGSWIVLRKPESLTPETFQVAKAQAHSRAQYGMAAKSMRVELKDANLSWTSFKEIRGTTVYAESEELTLVEEPIDDAIGASESDEVEENAEDPDLETIAELAGAGSKLYLDLEGLYEGLELGKPLILSGERSNVYDNTRKAVSGIFHQELVEIAAVFYGGQAEKAIAANAAADAALAAYTTANFILVNTPESGDNNESNEALKQLKDLKETEEQVWLAQKLATQASNAITAASTTESTAETAMLTREIARKVADIVEGILNNTPSRDAENPTNNQGDLEEAIAKMDDLEELAIKDESNNLTRREAIDAAIEKIKSRMENKSFSEITKIAVAVAKEAAVIAQKTIKITNIALSIFDKPGNELNSEKSENQKEARKSLDFLVKQAEAAADEAVEITKTGRDFKKNPGERAYTLIQLMAPLEHAYKRDTVKLYGNVVRATHGETRTEVLGSGDSSKVFQDFTLSHSPLTHLAAPTAAGAASTLQVWVNDVRWHETLSLAPLGTNDHRFVAQADDDGRTHLRFGNGIQGSRLPTGTENIEAVYRSGIGQVGNVKAQQISLLATRPLGVKGVTNPLKATGGADPETRDQARRNATLGIMALDRLVSLQDYADFVRSFAGISKAVATYLPNPLGGRRVVHLTIAGLDDSPIDETSDLFQNLLRALHQVGAPDQPVIVQLRESIRLVLSARIRIHPDHRWEVVDQQIRERLLGEFGFEQRELGQTVFPSEIINTIQQVPGVVYVDLDTLGGLAQTSDVNALSDEMTKILDQSLGGQPFEQNVAVRSKSRVDDEHGYQPAQIAYFDPAIPAAIVLNLI